MKRVAVLMVGIDSATDRRLGAAFEAAGAEVAVAPGAGDALETIRTRPISVLVASHETLAGPGLDLAARALRLRPHLVMVALGPIDSRDRAAAFRAGIFEVLSPAVDEALEAAVARVLSQAALLGELGRLRDAARDRAGLGGLVGRSAPLARAREEILALAATEVPVLLVGEPGTGKEHGARFLHAASRRGSAPFVVVEGQGSTPAADPFARRAALGGESPWERAVSGTLYLRDLCALAPDAQDRVAAALASGPSSLGPRVVGASRVDPDAAARSGRLPAPLRDAFEGAIVALPPLRERRDDVPFLARHFLEAIREMNALAEFRMTRETLELLVEHDWPGNARELRTAVEHAALVAEGGMIRPRDLPETVRLRKGPAGAGGGREETSFRDAKREAVDRFEREFLERLLDRHAGNVTDAALASGMMRSALQRLLRKHGIRSAAFRSGPGRAGEAER